MLRRALPSLSPDLKIQVHGPRLKRVEGSDILHENENVHDTNMQVDGLM